MKKLTAIFLSVILIFSVFAPAAFAATESLEYPVVYVTGSRDALYADKNNPSESNRIWKIGVDIGATVKEALAPCLKELAIGILEDDYDAYCDEVINHVVPLFEKVVLDKNGEASNGSGIKLESAEMSYPVKSSHYALMDYRFYYDWRLSPMDVSHQLKEHIDRVKEITGEEKVILIGRCMGANMVSAYFTEYYDHAVENIDSIVMYEPSNLGLDILGAMYSGQLQMDSDRVDDFLNYFIKNGDLFEDEAVGEFIGALVSVMNEMKALGIATDLVNKLLQKVKSDLIPELLLGTFGTFPSFWSMVGEEYYEDARAFIFNGREEEYKGLIEKNDDWFYNVMKGLPEKMKELENDGVDIGVIVKYNIPSYPFYADASQQTDMVSDVYHVSYYATSAPYGEVLSDDYINNLADKKYLSPDKTIDASTCLFPDTTWFIKNISHDPFPNSINKLIRAFLGSGGKMTVFDNENYPQYLEYHEENDTIIPITGTDEETTKRGTVQYTFSTILRFLKAFFNLIIGLFKK